MSDMISTTPQDAAIEALRERARQFDAELQDLARRTEIATACRDQFLDMAATLGRKSRSVHRKPRAVPEATRPGDAETPPTPAPTRAPLFTSPVVANDPVEEAA